MIGIVNNRKIVCTKSVLCKHLWNDLKISEIPTKSELINKNNNELGFKNIDLSIKNPEVFEIP